MYGGREDVEYYDDVWLLSVGEGSWRRLEPTSDALPLGRDHHSTAVAGGKMFAWGEAAQRGDVAHQACLASHNSCYSLG